MRSFIGVCIFAVSGGRICVLGFIFFLFGGFVYWFIVFFTFFQLAGLYVGFTFFRFLLGGFYVGFVFFFVFFIGRAGSTGLHFFVWAGAGGKHGTSICKCIYMYICTWDTQSFADGVEGAFSEFGAQSEYDPVVPGGSVNDGILSDEGSSRWVLKCDEDDDKIIGCLRIIRLGWVYCNLFRISQPTKNQLLWEK